MEMHFVHQYGTASDYLVLTAFFNIGPIASPFLTSINYSSASATSDVEVAITDSINPWSVLGEIQGNKEYISYAGSFTTPPCTEGVTFVLFRDFLQMNKAQWDYYATLFTSSNVNYTAGTGTYRAVQALNGRTVSLTYGVVTAANLMRFIGVLGMTVLSMLLA